MRRISSVGLVALLGAGACYSYVEPPPAAPQWSTTFVSGPPGGAMDPDQSSPFVPEDEAAAQPIEPDGTAPGSEAGPTDEAAMPAPSTDPADPGYAIGSVTDEEIDETLAPYGAWIETEDYGRVWRPDATVVGVDFTPYETCGSWAYTDYGWTFTCDWDWGWLPFHYGQWAWIGDSWGWVRDYTWSPAWVEWRSGGGYVGWRPLAPRVRDHRRPGGGPIIRDHRGGDRGGPIVRDHRRQRDSDWRFAHERDFGRTRIRASLYRNPAEGIRVTSTVSRPPVRGTRVSAADVMRDRIQLRYGRSGGGRIVRDHRGGGRGGSYQPPTRRSYQPTSTPPSRGTYQPRPSRPAIGHSGGNSGGTYQPTYTPPSRGSDRPPRATYDRPSRPTYDRPSRPTYDRPSRPGYSPGSSGTYQPPRAIRQQSATPRPSYSPSRPSYSPPSRPSYSPPSRPSYSPPSRPSYSSPRSSSSSSSSASSRSSSSSSSRGSSSSSSSSSSGSRSSGGGGGRRR
jgi:hypothetical protein